jgi:outer membrane immunogenic protein
MNALAKILMGCVAAGAVSISANAADMSVKARPMAAVEVYNWTGFYVGGHAGIGDEDPSGSITMQRFTGRTLTPHPLQSGTLGNNVFGFGGAQAGYNMQFGSWVAGIEADISAVTPGTRTLFLTEGPIGYTVGQNTGNEWFGTVRARAGYLFNPRTLGYVTGGLAYGQTRTLSEIVTGPGPIGTFAFNTGPTGVHAGWTVGVGLEYMLDSKWSVKAEYLYIDLGNQIGGAATTIVFNPGNTGVFTSSGNFRAHTGQIGVNYHFGGPVVAAY